MDEENNKLKKILKPQTMATLLALLILLAFAIIIPLVQGGPEGHRPEASEKNNIPAKESEVSILLNPFTDIDIESQAAIVWDIKNQEPLYEKNPEKIMPLASITKVLTASLSYDLLPPNTEVVIKDEFLQEEGDSGLYTNESWILKDLVDFTLMTSSNDGARAIASIAGSLLTGIEDSDFGREQFIKLMNEKVNNIGLSDTFIKNETGLDKNELESGSYGTAKEVALLFEYILKNHPEIFQSTRKSRRDFVSLDQIYHPASNTNIIVNEIPGIIGSKTGFTDLAGGNLGVIFDPSIGRPIITVVLGSSYDGRFTDTKKLVEATRSYIIQEKFAKEASDLELTQK